MTTILIIAEHNNKQVKPATYHAIAAGLELGDDIHVLVLGHDCQLVADELAKVSSVKKVIVASHNSYEHQLAENTAEVIASVASEYKHIVCAATTFGKNVMPRVAALLDVGMVGDVVKIISHDTFVRPIYAGNALATVRTSNPCNLITVRTTAFKAIKPGITQVADVTSISTQIENTLSHFEGQSLTQSSRPELTEARIIVSGGRGLKSAENFQMLESIADKLGAAIGASRAAVDAGFAPNDYQVGQTGKVVAPDLYIAVGISGAIQHLAGMKDSKVIVAINNDPEAPIFQVADYGLVGDLFKLLPEFENELEKLQHAVS